MLLPAIILVLLFSYFPMFGVALAFQNYSPAKGVFASSWVGMRNFEFLIHMPEAFRALRNTVVIALGKIALGLVVPVCVAILLNEMKKEWYKRTIQTLIYLPHFLSWIILGGVIFYIFSIDGGINQFLGLFGFKPIFFLGSNSAFPGVLVSTDVWKNFGYASIIYLAAITNISPTLFEAAVIDGASRWRQIWHVTLPGMAPIIVLLATLSMGDILNAGFEQVLALYNPAVYERGDIIDTLVYRLGLVNGRYSLAIAVGLFKSVVSLALISASYYLAYRTVNYRIF